MLDGTFIGHILWFLDLREADAVWHLQHPNWATEGKL